MRANLLISVLCAGSAAAALIWIGISRRDIPAPRLTSPTPAVSGCQDTETDSREFLKTAPAPSGSASHSNLWSRVESDEMRRFIANLRDTGCPEEIVRDVVTLRVARKYHSRLMASKSAAAAEWTDIAHPPAFVSSASGEDQGSLCAAMDRELEALLGVDADELKSFACRGWGAEEEDPFLPLEKRGRMREIYDLYRRLRTEARDQLRGAGEQELQAKFQALDQEREAEIAAILSPTEREQYALRYSKASQYVRSHLPEAKNEQEFRTMVQAVNETGVHEAPPAGRWFLARYGIFDPLEKRDTAAERRQAQKEQALREKLKDMLGDQRYEELYPAKAPAAE